MKIINLSTLACFLCVSGAFAAREGTPVYYQNQPAQQTANARQAQILAQQTYTYQVPRQQLPSDLAGAMTPAGVSTGELPPFTLSAGYTRRFASFGFKTGVNSALTWDNMIYNELDVRADANFQVRSFDMFAYGQVGYGTMSSGGFSMDYDLEPFDKQDPTYGIFTVSVGNQSGQTNSYKFGIGAKNIWDIGGFKLSPSIGYEIFQHNLKMGDHYYPNPATYIPLMTPDGQYVFGDENGNFTAVPQANAQNAVDQGLYQVCLTPEDIGVATVNPDGSLTFGSYDPSWTYLPWGVGPGQCVIIGGDGPILVSGTTHIYNTTWSGIYLGLEVEKQMTYKDKLRAYVEIGMPKYYSEGTWPNRTDWQQNPSFIDEGSTGSYSYLAELEYSYKLSDRLDLSIKADTNYFHVGAIGGKLFLAGYTDYKYDANGMPVFSDEFGNECPGFDSVVCKYPVLVTVDPHTEKIQNSLKNADWQSFGLYLGLKYSF